MPGKRKQCEEPTAEDLVDLFFNAQDAVEEGRADEAKGILKDCLEKIKEKLKTSDKSGDSGKQKPAKRAKRSDGEPAEHDDLPPLEVLQSAVYNTLGEVHLDDALILSGQQKLGKAPACKEAKKAFLKSIDSSLLKNNASACLSLASLARDSNDLKGAVEWYRKALEDPSLADDDSQRKRRSNTACGSWRDTWVINSWKTCREVAYYHLAILYCQGIAMDGLAVSWASREINSILQKFGFRFKLSKDVWNLSKKRPARGGRNPASASTRSAGRRGGAPAAAALPKPKMLLNAVSPQLKASLAESFSPSSPYWDETSYSGRGYFSWACDPEKPPTCTIEQLVHLVIDRSGIKPSVKFAEWWAHTRAPGRDIGHQLHFDTEEKTLEASSTIVHPLYSAVIYITGADAGGMTLVVDQKLEPPAPNAKGWAAHPSDGAILYFPGNLLHGVLPATTRRDTSVQRLTLLVALWGTRDFEPPEDNAIGPQAALPPAEDCAWVRNMVQKGLVRNPGDAAAAETDLLPIARVWEPVPRPRKKSEEEELAVPAAIDQRFFMKHLDFKKVLLEDHCGAGDSEDEEDEEDDE